MYQIYGACCKAHIFLLFLIFNSSMFCEFRWLLLFGTAEGTELGASHIACAGQLTVAIEGLVRVMAQHRARSLELLVRTVRYCSG